MNHVPRIQITNNFKFLSFFGSYNDRLEFLEVFFFLGILE